MDETVDDGAIPTPELFENELEHISERTSDNEAKSQP